MTVLAPPLPSPLRDAHPESRRARFARALDAAGLLDLGLRLRARLRPRQLCILTYHRIVRPSALGELDRGVHDATPEDFEAQLTLASKWGTFVSLSEVLRATRGGALPERPFLLTFDDAYADVLRVALPILRRRSIPAAVFVPTAYPDAGRLFWWDRIALVLRRSKAEELALPGLPRLRLGDAERLEQAVRCVTRRVKTCEGLDLEGLLESLEKGAGVTLGAEEERSLARASVLGWRELRALEAAGLELGSHGHQHRVLQTLRPAEAASDLRRSAALLAELLGRPVHSVAYPVGYPLPPTHRSAVAEAGFRLGFTNGTGLAPEDLRDPLGVPRLAMDLRRVDARFKASLLLGSAA